MAGGVGAKAVPVRPLWWCLFFAMAIVCHARNHVTFSGKEEITMGGMGRSLKEAGLDDYNDPGANPGHEPRTIVSPGSSGSGSSSGSGRKGRSSPDTP